MFSGKELPRCLEAATEKVDTAGLTLLGLTLLGIERLAQVGILAAKDGIGDSPFEEELKGAVVLDDAARRFGLKMIYPTGRQTLHIANPSLPKLGREVGVAVHTWRKLDTVTTHKIPHIAVNEVGRPGRALPVVHRKVAESPEEFIFAKVVDTVAIIAEETNVEGVVGLDHSAREEEAVVGEGFNLVHQYFVPTG